MGRGRDVAAGLSTGRGRGPGSPTGLLVGAGLTALLVLASAEAVHHLASRAWTAPCTGSPSPEDAGCAVVVLGYADKGPRAGAVNRRRARLALRTLACRCGGAVLIASGGPVAGPRPEAGLLAEYLRERGYSGPLLTESRSRSTWENVRNVAPMVEDAAEIVIVSDALHGAKARYLLRRLRPDLAPRLRQADDHRLCEQLLCLPVRALLGGGDLALTVCVPGWARRGNA